MLISSLTQDNPSLFTQKHPELGGAVFNCPATKAILQTKSKAVDSTSVESIIIRAQKHHAQGGAPSRRPATQANLRAGPPTKLNHHPNHSPSSPNQSAGYPTHPPIGTVSVPSLHAHITTESGLTSPVFSVVPSPLDDLFCCQLASPVGSVCYYARSRKAYGN